MKQPRILVLGTAVLVAAVSAGAVSTASSASADDAVPHGKPGSAIKHVIEIMVENHRTT